MTDQSPAPVAGDEIFADQTVEAIGAGREELVADLHRRADACHDLMKPGLSTRDAMRLHGKEAAYRHAAHLVNAALSPASPARTPMGGPAAWRIGDDGAVYVTLKAARNHVDGWRLQGAECSDPQPLYDRQALAASSPSPAQGGEEAEKLTEIVSDAEIVRVHGYANFGSMSPREVVNDGVLKTAVGYHCGHTQFSILREHGLVTKPRLGSYDAHLTKKGKAYARALYCRLAPPSVQPVEGK